MRTLVNKRREACFSTASIIPEGVWSNEDVYCIRAFWADIDATGAYVKRTTGTAYTAGRLQSMKFCSKETYITVGAPSYDAIHSLLSDSDKIAQFITDILADVREKDMTGVDIDFESQLSWTAEDYTAFKGIVQSLGNTLHAEGRKLQYSSAAYLESELPDNWDYSDFNSLPLDYMSIRLYGENWGKLSGHCMSSYSYLTNKLTYIKSKLDVSKIIPAINNYGYRDLTGEVQRTASYEAFYNTNVYNSFTDAVRDGNSGELQWEDGTYSYSYVDGVAMRLKEQHLRSLGFDKICVWSVRNDAKWFN